MSARTFGRFVCLKPFGIISPLQISITVYCIFSRHVYDNIFFLHLWGFFSRRAADVMLIPLWVSVAWISTQAAQSAAINSKLLL